VADSDARTNVQEKMIWGLVGLVQAPKVSRSQLIADSETGDANHVIQHRLTSGYETPCLGFGKHSEKAGYFQTTVDGNAAATLLIDEQKLSLQFGGDNDGFGFTRIELLPEHRNVVLVSGCDDTCPRRVKLDCVPEEFALYTRRNYDLRIQITKQVELA